MISLLQIEYINALICMKRPQNNFGNGLSNETYKIIDSLAPKNQHYLRINAVVMMFMLPSVKDFLWNVVSTKRDYMHYSVLCHKSNKQSDSQSNEIDVKGDVQYKRNIKFDFQGKCKHYGCQIIC